MSLDSASERLPILKHNTAAAFVTAAVVTSLLDAGVSYKRDELWGPILPHDHNYLVASP